MRLIGSGTAAALAGLAGLHALWGTGSSFPATDRDELADLVAGAEVVPAASECFVMAVALSAAATLVADVVPVPGSLRRVGVVGVSSVLAARGAVGLAGRTELLVPWTPSQRFVELDRRFYGPLCLALAAGSAWSLRR